MGDRVRLRIDLAYDGTGFRGFARQRDQRTVQGVLEGALQRIAGEEIRTTGAGRTDAGVHAVAQTVHCDVAAESAAVRDLDRLRRGLQALVGPEIGVWRVRRVPSSFDARFSATQRRYRYRIWDGLTVDPLQRHVTWHVGPPRLDVGAMQRGADHLVGEHDFSSFCRRAGDQHLVRRIDRVAVRRGAADVVIVSVDGAAFCHQMVRSVTGTLVAVGRGERPAEWVASVLAARDRASAGAVAPPHGLTLVGVSYGARTSG